MLPFLLDILRRLVFAVLGALLVVAGADWSGSASASCSACG